MRTEKLRNIIEGPALLTADDRSVAGSDRRRHAALNSDGKPAGQCVDDPATDAVSADAFPARAIAAARAS